jgi:arylsulfatase A-like enzyme
MTKPLSRREFLKLAGLTPAAMSIPSLFLKPERSINNPEAQNFIIIVLDTLTSLHMGLHGYPRETMPNLSRLTNRATIFHNHYAPGNFTTPGTASLLTGTYPWTHRGFKRSIPLDEKYEERNIFQAFNQYYRITYTHNPLVNTLLNQFSNNLDLYKRRRELYLRGEQWLSDLFKNDEDTANIGWIRSIKKNLDGTAYSLFLSNIYREYINNFMEDLRGEFPRGIPYISQDSFYLLEDATDWTASQLAATPQPFLGYFHYLPPHEPYFTRKEFFNAFKDDGVEAELKPGHILGKGGYHQRYINKMSRWYDEFILYADHEFYRLYTLLEETGLLENTWIILTSDHGELFERGMVTHMAPLLFESLVRIPLVIFQPGQVSRRDVFSNTNAVDLLPTLLHLSEQEIPTWCEGEVLPPYRDRPADENRSVFAFEAKESEQFHPTDIGTAMIVKGKYKLIYYYGYDKLKDHDPYIDLYNLEEDPGELTNLYHPESSIARELLEELKTRLEEADKPYRSTS